MRTFWRKTRENNSKNRKTKWEDKKLKYKKNTKHPTEKYSENLAEGLLSLKMTCP